jgi:AraC-like DNA-binding protein
MQPFVHSPRTELNAAARITASFIELLEAQFPIESTIQRISRRHPAAFADKLSVTINHLNKCLKETLDLTTITLITNRIMTEARMLLKNTTWNVSEIAWCLGFDEAPHFINFFKKHAGLSPNAFRNA